MTKSLGSASLLVFGIVNIATAAQSKIEFWNAQRKGSNFFNEVESAERLKAARDAGIQIVRLTFSKWKSKRPGAAPGTFLIGNLDQYAGLIEEDLQQLVQVLDQAQKLQLKVVLTTLSLPGSRWRQQNGNKNDLRLWQEEKFQKQAVSFWYDLALRLKNHPAVVAYNIINEPMPEMAPPKLNDWYKGDYEAWCRNTKGTPADLSLFYEKVVRSIRKVDSQTPIVLDAGFYATPWGFKCLRPLPDDKVIYSFHMYEPYAYTYYGNKGKYEYPGKAPIGEGDQPDFLKWNRAQLKKFLQPVTEWRVRNGVSAHRIYVGEFGVFRRAPGAVRYFKDLIHIFNEFKWHWGFYSFREDTWAGMDYELGPKQKLPEAYWKAEERGEHPTRLPYYRKNPLCDVILDGLKAR